MADYIDNNIIFTDIDQTYLNAGQKVSGGEYKYDAEGNIISPRPIINAIDILTKKDNMDYFDYIKLVKTNDLARKVKLADLKHNLLEERLKNNNSWKNILFYKYNKAKQELEI